MARIRFDNGLEVDIEGENPSHEQITAVWNDLVAGENKANPQIQRGQLPEDVKPISRELGNPYVTSAGKSVPQSNSDMVKSFLLNPAPVNASLESSGDVIKRKLDLPEPSGNLLQQALSLRPADLARPVINSDAAKAYYGGMAADVADMATTPANILADPLLKGVGMIPLKAGVTVGKLAEIPIGKIKDAVSGKLTPYQINKLIVTAKMAKIAAKHGSEEVKNKPVDLSQFTPTSDKSVQPLQIATNADFTPTGTSTAEAIPKQEAAPQQPFPGTGDVQTRGLSQHVEDKAIRKNISDMREGFGDLPEYAQVNMQDQASKAASLMGDRQKAFNIAMGNESAPNGIIPEAIFIAVENDAINRGDVEMLRSLAVDSKLVTEATTMGQRIRTLGERNRESAVGAIKDVIKAREKQLERSGKKNAAKNDAKIGKLKEQLDAAQKELDKFKARKEKANPATPKFGSQNKVFTKQLAESASKSLRSKLASLHSGVDPTLLKEITQIGGYYFEGGIRNSADWSKKMVTEFGEKIKPYLDAAWFHINKTFNNSDRDGIIKKVGSHVAEGKELHEIGSQIGKLAENLVASGIKDRDKLVDAVFNQLKDVIPGLTKRETMDAISGYGKYRKLSPDQIKAKLRDLKGQMQQVSKLEDLAKNKPPLKTGVEHRTPSDEERRLIKLVDEAKKKSGITTTDPATQLKSKREALKTRLVNEIADLKKQIDMKQRFVNSKYAQPDSPELTKLRLERDKLKEQLSKIVGKPELTQAQKNKINLRSLKTRLEHRINEMEEKLQNNDFSSKPKSNVPQDIESVALEAKRDRIQMAYDAAKKLNEGKADVSLVETREIMRLSKAIADKKALIDPKSPIGSPSRMEYGRALADFGEYVSGLKHNAEKLTLDEFKARPVRSTAKALVNVSGIGKALKSTGDFSMLLRQGYKTLINHPTIWAKNAAKSFVDASKMFGKENVAREVKANILSRPNSLNGNYKKFGLDVSTVEEQFPNNWLDNLPGVGKIFKGFENMFVNFLHRTRADVFDSLYENITKAGGNPEGLGRLVNEMTGRGGLGKLEPIAKPLNLVFFSARYIASELEFLTMHLLDHEMSGHVKKISAKNFATTLGSIAGILVTAYAVNPKSVELNPNSSDFGTIRVGDTRYDVTQGMKGIFTLLSRFLTEKSKSSTTDEISEYNTGKYGSKTLGDAFAQYLQNRFSPALSVLNDVKFRGTDFKGDKPTIGGELQNLAAPFPIESTQELMADPNSANLLGGIIANQLGISTSTYADNYKSKFGQIRKGLMEKHKTYMDLIASGKSKEAKEYASKNLDLLTKKMFDATQYQITSINKTKHLISLSPRYTDQEKKDKIEKIDKHIDNIVNLTLEKSKKYRK